MQKFSPMQVLMIGCGNMGYPMVKSLQAMGHEVEVVLQKGNENNIRQLESEGIHCYEECIVNKAYDCVILAYKPQAIAVTDTYAKQIMQHNDLTDTIIISIMAGVKIAKLKHFFPTHKVVRVMPNMSLKVQKGFSAYYCDEILSVAQINNIDQLLKTFGICYRANSEAEIDKITVLSGSGPAYIAKIVEGYIAAGIEIGLDEAVAKEAVYQTFLGTLMLIVEGDEDPAQLRRSITSKAGVTEAALKVLDELDLFYIISHSIQAALNRAHELSQE